MNFKRAEQVLAYFSLFAYIASSFALIVLLFLIRPSSDSVTWGFVFAFVFCFSVVPVLFGFYRWYKFKKLESFFPEAFPEVYGRGYILGLFITIVGACWSKYVDAYSSNTFRSCC